MKGGGRRSRHDHAPCRRRRSDALSEKDYEIYLDMKLQWLHQFYVTANSRKQDEEKEASQKRYIDERSEEIHSNLGHGEVNSTVRDEVEGSALEFMEEVEPEIENDGIKGGESISEPLEVVAKPEGAEVEGDEIDGDPEPPREQVTMEVQKEKESLTKEPPPEPPEPPERGMVYDKEGEEAKGKGDWELKKVDLTFNPMGQAHKFIITPAIFANNRGVLQVEKDMDKKKLVGSDWPQNPGMSMNFKGDASLFGSIGAPKIDVDVSATAVSFSKNREATILYVLLKSTFKRRAFDPGGSSSMCCVAWTSCFKLWDPGGKVLIICFGIFTLRTR